MLQKETQFGGLLSTEHQCWLYVHVTQGQYILRQCSTITSYHQGVKSWRTRPCSEDLQHCQASKLIQQLGKDGHPNLYSPSRTMWWDVWSRNLVHHRVTHCHPPARSWSNSPRQVSKWLFDRRGAIVCYEEHNNGDKGLSWCCSVKEIMGMNFKYVRRSREFWVTARKCNTWLRILLQREDNLC